MEKWCVHYVMHAPKTRRAHARSQEQRRPSTLPFDEVTEPPSPFRRLVPPAHSSPSSLPGQPFQGLW